VHPRKNQIVLSIESIFKEPELFCQTIYQNGSNSTDGTVQGAEAQKLGFTGELEPCQIGPKRTISMG
jgi:hypothetical protein